MTVEYQKVWTTMNDLELVTSKICSAREIIDSAIDRIQENQYDKAEMMMSAAYEYLEYYLQEFDDKFKLAWQATVGDLRDTVVSTQYTEEELNAMCDKAASDEEKEKCREYNLREAEYYDKRVKLDAELEQIRKEGGFEWTPEVPKKKWVLSVQQEYVDGGGEYYVNFPDDLLETANLKEGDVVEWVDNNNGTYNIRKV